MNQEPNLSKSEIKVRLIISGFKDVPDSITSKLGCEPSETWIMGDRVMTNVANVHHENGWVIQSTVDPFDTTLDKAIEALLAMVPNRQEFKNLPPESEIEIGCAVFVHSEQWPNLGLSSKVISKIASIGASFDLDLYPPDLPEHSE